MILNNKNNMAHLLSGKVRYDKAKHNKIRESEYRLFWKYEKR